MKSEMSRAAALFQSAQSKFLGLLNAYREKFPGETEVGGAHGAEPEPPIVDASETTTEETPEAETSDEQGRE